MMLWLSNVWTLAAKELRSLLMDRVLVALILFAFSVAVLLVAQGVKAEVANATVGIIDADRSELSLRLRDAFRPPYFKTPRDIARADVAPAMDAGRIIFVIEIPPRFQADLIAGRSPEVQVLVDATAMTQAGLGASYIQQIVADEALEFLHARGLLAAAPVGVVSHIRFNPNATSSWYTSVMLIVIDVTVLAIILVGAAVIREREHGTIEHLLVMPVRASEIAFAKILANGLVIFVAAFGSLILVVHGLLGVPLAGSLWLFAGAMTLYLFAVTALGVFMATLASSMPQFGMLSVPVYAIAYLLSGAATPIESMPPDLQVVARVLPTTQFVTLSQAILYRGAGIAAVWPQILAITAWGSLFVGLALQRFRAMLARQG